MSVVIPEEVSIIEENVFYLCESLTNITLPKGITSIDINTFNSCSSLTSIVIPEGVITINPYSFYNCSNLTSVTIPESVSNIWNSAFSKCTGLTDVIVNWTTPLYVKPNVIEDVLIDNVLLTVPLGTEINYQLANVWQDFKINNLVTFNDGVLEYTVIDATNNYVSVIKYHDTCPEGDLIIPETVENLGIIYTITDIREKFFSNCDSLISVTIPESVTNIGDGAFRYCSSLTNMIVNWTIPLDIEPDVFEGLTVYNITLTVPEGTASTYLTSPVWEDFKTISNLETFNDGVLEYTIIDTVNNYVSVGKYNEVCPSGDLIIPETVLHKGITYNIKVIGNSAFSSCEDLTNVTIPKGVTSIGNIAFSGCTSLTSIALPENLIEIRNGAFIGSNLTNIVFPENLKSIGNSAFRSCKSLTNITIPEGITSIGDLTFSNCESLINVNLPEGIISIGNGAFLTCDNLYSINIPKSVTSIEANALAACWNLYKVTVNWETLLNLTISNSGIFFYTPIQEGILVVPIGTKEIYESAYPWSRFGSIIEEDSFFNDGVLEYTIINTENKYVSVSKYNRVCPEGNLTIPEMVDYNGITYTITAIENYAFKNCQDLLSITIPNSVTSIGSSAFYGCTNLENITIPDSVTSIGSSTFHSCTNLETINIPNSVTSIDLSAFYNCTNLNTVTVNWQKPLNIYSYVFTGVDIENTTLYVPEGTVSTYQSAEVWQDFNIQETSSLGTEDIILNKIKVFPNPVKDILNISVDNSIKLEKVKLYNLQGQLIKQVTEREFSVSEFSSGIYILQIATDKGKETKKIVIK